ncbi:LOB domain-containing protein [Actinidia chinensis var. chinensis]|uniref:LOB domain-containing protein n=1 Tax=Actinidia chinensis var. chinensis TaxID=1590841 RepID=A0A2R6RNC1_ACTCC|nr:LOB domain-containing protein [Actinidia chinensis var. chinensis]
MSCNGCRALRKGCGESCILRPCLEWIESPRAQSNATLFVSKFFGRSDLLSFIAAVPESKRPALFQSLLFEACGRTVNPVNGAVGLLSTGNWHVCQTAVNTVLAGGTLRPLTAPILTHEASDAFDSSPKIWNFQKCFSEGAQRQPSDLKTAATMTSDSGESEMVAGFHGGNYGAEKLRAEEPKLLNLFV